jgi:D123
MSAHLEFPPLTGQDVLNCSFSSWYTKYHRLSPRARIIKPLPESFLNFLKSDGIVLPGGSSTGLISEAQEVDSGGETEGEETADESLAHFTAQLAREISFLNGSVVPKLNWSTPKVVLLVF